MERTFSTNLPNILSIGRLVGGLFFIFIWYYWGPIWALAVFFILIASDFFDGYFSRKFNCESRLGAFLDPLADKCLTAPSLIFVLYVHYLGFPETEVLFFLWLIVLLPILFYEIQSTWHRIRYYHELDFQIKAKLSGKFKVFFLYMSIGTILILQAYSGSQALSDSFLPATIFLTLAFVCIIDDLIAFFKFLG